MRLLLIEDDPALAEVTRRFLVGDGHVVQIERDGVSGLLTGCQEEFDVIILDIMLPGLNGYDVLKKLREHRVWTPVIMLTAKDGEYDQEDAFDLGADDYLTKPFSLVVLSARLRALARRGTKPRPVVLTAPDLSLEPRSHKVFRFGQELELTPREFSLLEFLLRRKLDTPFGTNLIETIRGVGYRLRAEP